MKENIRKIDLKLKNIFQECSEISNELYEKVKKKN